ncbi:MAG: GNAT family N-acetyltransferase [Ardenticatenaceae bacterium]|nr:GNAT family N-acetyltransferase [Anaerolineales bacterium]MCB8939002.1 GNAT family N-acetyltransferase [Ardenticatenaceae bacterium]MCB8974758.1 GNAT family N-acetyltransferase [Ardenticatenaceae bacterium]
MSLIQIKIEERHKLAHLFQDHPGGLIPQSILDGYSGRALANQTLKFAALEIPSARVCILGGDFSQTEVREYLKSLPGFSQVFFADKSFIDVAQEVHPGKWIELERHAFSADRLNPEYLKTLKSKIPDGFQIVKIDISLARQLRKRKNKFAKAHGFNFVSPEDFIARGFGYCALDGKNIACVGSSFAVCDAGIEIQIDTQKQYQGKGLATAVAAHLIIECLEKNLVPSWDAATTTSAKLAEKLGYMPEGVYTMMVFTNSRFLVSLRNTIRRIKSSRTKQ